MKLNGTLKSEGTSEWVRLRRDWKKWNNKCQEEDIIDWEEYYEEHKK